MKAEQSRIQFVSTRKAYVEMLSRLVGEPIGEDVEFVKPAVLRAGGEVNRPELQLYDSQIRHLQVKDKEIRVLCSRGEIVVEYGEFLYAAQQ